MIKLSLPSKFSFSGVKVDKTKTEFEIFVSNFQAVNHEEIIRTMTNGNEVVKSVCLSQINRLKGNEAYLRCNYKEALELYYTSLAFAPYDTITYGFAIANRTVALFSLKKYEECLKDIENIWDTKYPKQQYFKVYIRQSACYLYIEQYSKAFECNVKARRSLIKFKNTLSQSQYDKVQSQINNIFSKIKPYDAFTTVCELTKPELKDEENPKFLNASNCVDLKYNDTVGRYVVTKTDIERGDILFVEEPYSAVRVDELKYRYTYCSHCLVYSAATIPCNECIIHFYCSKTCKQLAWDKGHKWECYGERKNILNSAMRLPLNTIFKASQNNFKTIMEDESVYGSNDNNFAYINKLVTNMDKMDNEEICNFTKLSIWLVIYLKEYTNFFNWLQEQPNNTDKSMSELFDWIGGILLKLCLQIQCNCSDIVDVSISNLSDFNLDLDFIGYGLYTSTSMINHSCVPNTQISFCHDLKIIRATKNIKKNTEITIDYADFIGRIKPLNSSFLLETYKFNCSCIPSLETKTNPWLCYGCQGKAFNCSETEAICSNCKQFLSTVTYKYIETNVFALYSKVLSVQNINYLDYILTSIRTIYHPEHEEFINYYMWAYDLCVEKYDVLKCWNITKNFVEHSEKYFDIDIQFEAYLRLMNATATYYGLMLQNKVPHFYGMEYYFREILEKTKDLLKYFVSLQNVEIYDLCFQNYLVTYN